jgi:uncharacterized protein (TIGR02246 family)
MGDPMQSAANDIVTGIIKKWTAGFAAMDAAALTSLYSRKAFFFGSNPSLYRGHDGVAAYFKGLPKWRSRSAEFTDVRAAQAGPDLINMAAIASFAADDGAWHLSVKMTWVIVREDGDWKIVSHHASSRVPLI